jgi:hypothetical protein
VTRCPVVCENQAKYNRHTNKFHSLNVDEVHENMVEIVQVAEAAAGAGQEGVIEALLKNLVASTATQHYGKQRPGRISDRPSTKEVVCWVNEWQVY